jgi:hypothetical protein
VALLPERGAPVAESRRTGGSQLGDQTGQAITEPRWHPRFVQQVTAGSGPGSRNLPPHPLVTDGLGGKVSDGVPEECPVCLRVEGRIQINLEHFLRCRPVGGVDALAAEMLITHWASNHTCRPERPCDAGLICLLDRWCRAAARSRRTRAHSRRSPCGGPGARSIPPAAFGKDAFYPERTVASLPTQPGPADRHGIPRWDSRRGPAVIRHQLGCGADSWFTRGHELASDP